MYYTDVQINTIVHRARQISNSSERIRSLLNIDTDESQMSRLSRLVLRRAIVLSWNDVIKDPKLSEDDKTTIGLLMDESKYPPIEELDEQINLINNYTNDYLGFEME